VDWRLWGRESKRCERTLALFPVSLRRRILIHQDARRSGTRDYEKCRMRKEGNRNRKRETERDTERDTERERYFDEVFPKLIDFSVNDGDIPDKSSERFRPREIANPLLRGENV
jgi:hypothetical protein